MGSTDTAASLKACKGAEAPELHETRPLGLSAIRMAGRPQASSSERGMASIQAMAWDAPTACYWKSHGNMSGLGSELDPEEGTKDLKDALRQRFLHRCHAAGVRAVHVVVDVGRRKRS